MNAQIGLPDHSWRIVRLGLAFMFWGILTLFIGCVAHLAATLLAFGHLTGGPWERGEEGGSLIFFLPLWLTMLASFSLVVIGHCCCVAAPYQSGAKGLATGSMVCALLTVLFAGTMGVEWIREALFARGDSRRSYETIARILTIFASGVPAHLLFTLFVRGLAHHFNNRTLAASANAYLSLFLVSIPIQAIGAILAITAHTEADTLICIGLPSFVLAVLLVFSLLRLVARARALITLIP